MLSCNAGLWFEAHLSEENKTNSISSLCAPYLPGIFAEEHTATVRAAACLSLTSSLTRAPRYVMSGCLEDVRTEACRARVAHLSYLGRWVYKTYRAELKSGPKIVEISKASCGRSGKQQQEQNSPSLGSTFFSPSLYFRQHRRGKAMKAIHRNGDDKKICPVGLHLSNTYFPWKRSDGHCTGDTDCSSFFRKVTSDKETFLVMDVSWLSCSAYGRCSTGKPRGEEIAVSYVEWLQESVVISSLV